MAPAEGTLFAIDDDQKARKALAALASSLGINYELFSSAEEFLDYYQPSLSGCVLTDLRLQGMSGLELQERLKAMGSVLPVILITAYADVPLAVRAMKNGALAVIEKPYQADELTDAIRAAFKANAGAGEAMPIHLDMQERLKNLNAREHRLMELVVAGIPNKRIAGILGISQRTVDRVRASVFLKMRVESAVELAQVIAEFRGSRLAQKYHKEAGIQFPSKSGPKRLDPSLEIVFHSIIQASLNAVFPQHHGRKVHISLEPQDSSLRIDFRFSPSDISREDDEKLRSELIQIQDQITSLGGKVTTQSAADHGFFISILLPLTELKPD